MINELDEVMLVDLGSVRNAKVKIENRTQAIEYTDLIAETITAPFRPPELFDVSSKVTSLLIKAIFDERTDIWSLGCTFYSLLYTNFPFDGSATAAASGQYNKATFME